MPSLIGYNFALQVNEASSNARQGNGRLCISPPPHACRSCSCRGGSVALWFWEVISSSSPAASASCTWQRHMADSGMAKLHVIQVELSQKLLLTGIVSKQMTDGIKLWLQPTCADT